MNHFPDTSFLCALYRVQDHSGQANRYMRSLDRALPVSSLLILEFRQSVRLQIKLHQSDRTKGFPAFEGERMLRNVRLDLAGRVLESVPADWTVVHHLAEVLSQKHALNSGNRLMDILHVATALHLGASEFLTFDARQRALAEAEGLTVPL